MCARALPSWLTAEICTTRASSTAISSQRCEAARSGGLTCQNLLFRGPEEDADLLIADFGLSRVIDDQKLTVLTTTCGTPGYMVRRACLDAVADRLGARVRRLRGGLD